MILSNTTIHLTAGTLAVEARTSNGHRWIAIGNSPNAVSVHYSDLQQLLDFATAITAAAENMALQAVA